MKGTSNLIMWLTFVLVVSLAMVLGLVLLLLAELYCWPVIRRLRRRRASTPNGAPLTTTTILSPSLLENQETGNNDIEKQRLESLETDNVDIQKDCLNESFNGSSLVYISNPVFDNENVTKGIVDEIDLNVGTCTPFETPDSSPSRLETEDESDDESPEMEEISSKVVLTPALSPTKKPATDASLGTSLSDTSTSNNGVSSSSLLTPCTSPSL